MIGLLHMLVTGLLAVVVLALAVALVYVTRPPAGPTLVVLASPAVGRIPMPPPPPDPLLINPRFAAHIAKSSAATAARLRAVART